MTHNIETWYSTHIQINIYYNQCNKNLKPLQTLDPRPTGEMPFAFRRWGPGARGVSDDPGYDEHSRG